MVGHDPVEAGNRIGKICGIALVKGISDMLFREMFLYLPHVFLRGLQHAGGIIYKVKFQMLRQEGGDTAPESGIAAADVKNLHIRCKGNLFKHPRVEADRGGGIIEDGDAAAQIAVILILFCGIFPFFGDLDNVAHVFPKILPCRVRASGFCVFCGFRHVFFIPAF